MHRAPPPERASTFGCAVGPARPVQGATLTLRKQRSPGLCRALLRAQLVGGCSSKISAARTFSRIRGHSSPPPICLHPGGDREVNASQTLAADLLLAQLIQHMLGDQLAAGRRRTRLQTAYEGECLQCGRRRGHTRVLPRAAYAETERAPPRLRGAPPAALPPVCFVRLAWVQEMA